MKTPNVGLQFVATILVISLATGVWFAAATLISGGSASIAFGNVAVSALWSVPFVSAVCLCIGFPVSLLLGIWRVESVWAWAAAGALSGAALFGIPATLIGDDGIIQMLLLGTVPGLIGSLYWWWAVVRHFSETPSLDSP